LNDLITAKASTIRFWNFGGTAINLARSYRHDQPANPIQQAEELFTYVDTSFSNLAGAADDDLFVINGGKGLGKDQKKGIEIFKKELPNIMAKNKPGVINVVVLGISGGTGSTGGRMCIEKLLEAGEDVFAILISSHDSDRSTANAIGCVINLEKAVKRTGRPLVAYYYENDRTLSLPKNNTAPLFVMRLLSILASGKNLHLDISDVSNLINYNRVTKYDPALSLLEVYAGEEMLLKNSKNLIGFAALLKSKEEVMPQVKAAYDTVGYLPEEGRVFDNSFYYTVSTTGFGKILEKLRGDLEEYTRGNQGSETVATLLTGEEDEEDTVL
jgi:hypothetical protein